MKHDMTRRELIEALENYGYIMRDPDYYTLEELEELYDDVLHEDEET